MIPDELKRYVRQSYTFEDGNSITILDIKRRDDYDYWVTYSIKTGPGLPQKLMLKWPEFKEHYGHLFP